MARHESHDYGQRVMIPVSLEEQLVPGTLEFEIQTLAEDRMDRAVFEIRYPNDETGRAAYRNSGDTILTCCSLKSLVAPHGKNSAGGGPTRQPAGKKE